MTRLLAALAIVSTVLFATPASAVIQGCLPNPLPAPTAPVFSRDVQKFSFSDQMHLDVWRVPCDGSSALLMKVTPLSTAPFLCESDFSILEGGAPFEFALADASDSDFCAPLLTPRTFSLVPKTPHSTSLPPFPRPPSPSSRSAAPRAIRATRWASRCASTIPTDRRSWS
jgi:hypothetical protein